MNNIEVTKNVSISQHNVLANDILLSSYEYIESIQDEIRFIKEELSRCKSRMITSQNPRTSLMLSQQYKLLLASLNDCQNNLAVTFMASYKPLSNLLIARDEMREAQETPLTTNLPLEVNLDEIYKPYED